MSRAQQRADRLPELIAATEAARGRVMSRQRDITVEVDHTGAVTSLQITDDALGRGGARLASELLGLLGQARHEVQKQMLVAAGDLLGEDDPIVGTYRAAVEAETEASAGDVSPRGGGLW